MTTLAESFNTADSDTLGPDLAWVEDVGDVDIVSNRARCITAGAALARSSSALAGNNIYAEIVAHLPASVNHGIGPIVRKNESSTQTYYLLWLTDSSGRVVTMYKVIAGAFTALGATGISVSWTNGDTLRIEANGTTIRGLINGVEVISRTDSAIDGTTVGGKATGMRYYDAGAGDCEVDSFAAGDLSASATSLPPRRGGASFGNLFSM